jgi:uncharacterized protein
MRKVAWDEAKRQWTLLHRRIDFIDFMEVFDDPAGVVRPDTRQDYGEQRWNILCPVNGRLHHVTYTMRGDICRIISVRKANRREQRSYERERANRHGH